jgi:hypothetical protein
MTKKNTGARWEVTVDGKPRTYDRNRELAIEAGQNFKQKNPNVDVAVRDLEGVEGTVPKSTDDHHPKHEKEDGEANSPEPLSADITSCSLQEFPIWNLRHLARPSSHRAEVLRFRRGRHRPRQFNHGTRGSPPRFQSDPE